MAPEMLDPKGPKGPKGPKDLLTVTEVIKEFDITKHKLLEAIDQGEVSILLKPDGSYFIYRKDIKAWIQGRRNEGDKRLFEMDDGLDDMIPEVSSPDASDDDKGIKLEDLPEAVQEKIEDVGLDFDEQVGLISSDPGTIRQRLLTVAIIASAYHKDYAHANELWATAVERIPDITASFGQDSDWSHRLGSKLAGECTRVGADAFVRQKRSNRCYYALRAFHNGIPELDAVPNGVMDYDWEFPDSHLDTPTLSVLLRVDADGMGDDYDGPDGSRKVSQWAKGLRGVSTKGTQDEFYNLKDICKAYLSAEELPFDRMVDIYEIDEYLVFVPHNDVDRNGLHNVSLDVDQGKFRGSEMIAIAERVLDGSDEDFLNVKEIWDRAKSAGWFEGIEFESDHPWTSLGSRLSGEVLHNGCSRFDRRKTGKDNPYTYEYTLKQPARFKRILPVVGCEASDLDAAIQVANDFAYTQSEDDDDIVDDEPEDEVLCEIDNIDESDETDTADEINGVDFALDKGNLILAAENAEKAAEDYRLSGDAHRLAAELRSKLAKSERGDE